MVTAMLSTVLVYLLMVRHDDRRQHTSKDVEWLKQDVGCYLIDLQRTYDTDQLLREELVIRIKSQMI